jgi:hypothetical protein
MNMKKTKVMAGTTTTPKLVQISGSEIKQVEEYIHLGQRFSLSKTKTKTMK